MACLLCEKADMPNYLNLSQFTICNLTNQQELLECSIPIFELLKFYLEGYDRLKNREEQQLNK